MTESGVSLTEQDRDALQEVSRQTGRSVDELLREALDYLIREFLKERKVLMRRARGIWKDRADVPSADELRRDWDRVWPVE